MTEPLTHARIGYDSIGTRGAISSSGALTGFPAAAAASPLTYSFWSAGLPATWQVSLTEAERCNYFGIAAHTLNTNHVVAVMQAFIDATWQTLPVLSPVGELWRFNSELFGERGAAHGVSFAPLRRGVAADGVAVKRNGFQESKFGPTAIAHEPAATNVLPANVRDCGDTSQDLTGFDAGSTASYSTDHAVSGAGSALLDNGGAAADLLADAVAVSMATDYTASCKILPSAEISTVEIKITGDVTGLIATGTYNDLDADSWHIISVTGDSGTNTTIEVAVEIDGQTAWVDELQLETGTIATSWANDTRVASDLAYQPEIWQQLKDIVTVNIWVKCGSTLTGAGLAERGVFEVQFGTAERLRMILGGNDVFDPNNVRVDVVRNSSSGQQLSSDLIYDDDWHMITVVLDESSNPIRSLYVDGKLKASDNSFTPDWSNMSQFTVGKAGSFTLSPDGETLIGELLIMNRAATPQEIRGWYDSGEAMDLAEVGLPYHDDDRPIMRLVDPATSNKFRIRLVGQTTPVVGVIYMGNALEMQQAIYGGHTPQNLARMTTIRPNLSDGGQFLGRSIIRSGSDGSWSWRNLTANWVRTYLDPFLISALTTPFFILWRPETFPGEAGYCWTMGDQSASNMGTKDFMQFALSAKGLGVE